MKKILLLILSGILLNKASAQDGKWNLRLGLNQNIPVYSSSTKLDNNYLSLVTSISGYNLACGYNITEHWQASLQVSSIFFPYKDERLKPVIMQSATIPGSLRRITFSDGNNITALSLELKYLFRYKGWQIAPFVRSNFMSITTAYDFALYEKVENEHYYRKTDWINADDSTINFNPGSFTAGIFISKQIYKQLSLYTAIQYTQTIMKFEMIKEQSDFYGKKSSEPVQFEQRYRFFGAELGLQYTFRQRKKMEKS